MIWYFKSNQKQNNRNRKEIKERERRKLPGAHLPGPARPSPSPLPPCRLPLPVGRGEAWRASTPATSCFALEASPSSLSMRGDATQPPGAVQPSLSSPGPRSLLCSLPARARAELVVADAVRRSHRAPRCHPKYPGDPPRPPLPPRREAHRGSPCNVATAVVFHLQRPSSPPVNSALLGPPRAR